MPVAELQNVTKNYGAVTALHGIDLAIERGELLAVLGPNGAGKTTAVRILLGLTEQTSGRAAIFGQAPASHAAKLRRGAMLQVARVPETIRRARAHRTVLQLLPQAAQVRGHHRRRRTGRRGEAPLRGTLRRTETARAVCAGHLRQSRPAVPGRAYCGAGCGSAARDVETHSRIRGARRQRAAHHPLPGRGGCAGRPDRRDRWRPHHRARHAC